ncbi:MAG: LemA family protein [Bacilli bacterium]|nr:LemA family protein [Bacilli bacterium]
MQIIYIILIIVFVVSTFGMIYVYYFNNLQYIKTKIEQAESIIDETIRDRYDIMVRASDIVKSNLQEKKDYFKEYIQLKNSKISNFEMDRKLKEAVNIIFNLRNDYPVLQEHSEMKEICYEIQKTTEKLSASIAYYNRYTSELNEYIRKFPSNLIAKIHHFQVKPFFDGKDMNDDDLLDFKL